MHPTLFTIPGLPEWLGEVKSYGVMMMIAFLTGIWMACRRAMRSQGDPDIVLNTGFLALIFGVIGARIMFVLHYWDTRFATQPNPVMAAFNCRGGGLEFWGGPILAIPAILIYTRYFTKASVRWYADIAIPSLAWGLAITRIGCFLNGCCWGAVCVEQPGHVHAKPALAWTVQFPYGSPAMIQQFRFGQLSLPNELIYVGPDGIGAPLPAEWIEAAAADAGRSWSERQARVDAFQKQYQQRRNAGADAAELERIQEEIQAAIQALQDHERGTGAGVAEQQARKYGLSVPQLASLAANYRSQPVHPAQLYAVINALLLSGLLSLIYYYRRHHGTLIGWFLVLYSPSRMLLELIRQDNPLDVGGLSISQAISIGTFLLGVVWLYVIYTRFPARSPAAVPFVPPEAE